MQNSEKLEEFLSYLRNNQDSLSDIEYYAAMRKLAHLVREKYGVVTSAINLNVVRAIYKYEGIRIDIWPKGKFKKLRAAYLCSDGDPSVLITDIPREPRLFALLHELKHHYTDQDRIVIECFDITDKSPRIEIGAEVFAAEFLFPMAEFKDYLSSIGVSYNNCSPQDVCRLKHHSPVPVSYIFLCKRLYSLKIVPKGSFSKVQFTKLHDQIYGEPIYKQLRRRSNS